MSSRTKPFLKWVGGKSQILDTILNKFPTEIQNYYEPFLGGGSILFGLLDSIRSGCIRVEGKIYASDVNVALVYVYKNIQTQPQSVIDELDKLVVNKEAYYKQREIYNSLTQDQQCTPNGSALFIYLNKTCFRGLFRVGPNGFNVPYGHYKNPEIYNSTHIYEISSLIQNVYFEACDFSDVLIKVSKGDFVYMDPPYDSDNLKGFTNYTKIGFSKKIQQSLFDQIHVMASNDIRFMMCNACTNLVKECFPGTRYDIQTITCRRAINSKHPESTTEEIIITLLN